MLLDTHCHLTDAKYRDDLPGVLERAGDAGVLGIVAIASNLEDVEHVRALVDASRMHVAADTVEGVGRGAAALPRLWGTAGVHPHEAAKAPPDLKDRLRDLLPHPGIVAIGECGLDFYYELSPRDVQRRVFGEQIEVAGELNLPLVVHCRDAEVEMTELVRKAGKAGVEGVLHCFPGDPDLLAAAVESGWLVSFTGLVTFKSFSGTEAVRNIPAGRYMLETDGPYMAPVPHRGKRNEPSFIPQIRDRVSGIRGESPEVVERDTGDAARRFFRLADTSLGG
jgi:TatD DNase family protein